MAKHLLTVVRGSQLLPFVRHIEGSGIKPAGLLRRCYCPISVDLEGQDCCVPTKRFWQLIEETAWLLKEPQSGWEIAAKYGLQGSRYLGYQLENQPSLRQALELYIQIISKHSNSADLELKIRGNDLWLLRVNPLQRSTNFPQVEMYFAGLLIHLIRNYLGEAWQPEKLSICGTPKQLEQHPLANHCGKLLPGSDHLGIAIPLDGLDLKPQGVSASIQSPGPLPASLPSENHHILKCILHCYLDDYPATRPSISKILGLQPKTLARLLARDDTSFRAIKNEVLMERARTALRDSHLSIGEVAKLLQYAHQSAFTRAFEQQVGVSPEQFRAIEKTRLAN